MKELSPRTHVPVPEPITSCLSPPGVVGAKVASPEFSLSAGPIKTFPLPVTPLPAKCPTATLLLVAET